MNDFKLSRFWQTLKWLVLTNKRQLLKITLIMLLVFFMEQLFVILVGRGYSHNTYPSEYGAREMLVFGAVTFNYVTWAIFDLVMCSQVCGSLRSKQQRIMLFTHPASKSEKYVARLVYYLVLVPVLTGLAMLLVNVLRIGVDVLAGFGAEGFLTNVIIRQFSMPFDLLLFNGLSLLWIISVFVLGGTFFRKVPFFMTAGVLLALGVLLAIVMLMFSLSSLFAFLDSEAFKWIMYVFYALFTVLNFWLSYRLYSRMQVIQNRWFNV